MNGNVGVRVVFVGVSGVFRSWIFGFICVSRLFMIKISKLTLYISKLGQTKTYISKHVVIPRIA